ncbi:MAG: NAD(P)/FAD-dependent oxidoreductase [Thermoplasmatota archaeon]
MRRRAVARAVQVLVVGGGIMGAASALALAEAGHGVELVEGRGLGHGSSAKAAGILSAMTWNDDDYRLIAATRGLTGELISLAMAEGTREARGAWRPAPSILVGGPGEAGAMDRIQDRLERMTEETDRLDFRRAAREFPEVEFAPGEEVLVAQEDGVIEAGDLFAALRTRLAGEGVVCREGEGVAALEVASGRATGVRFADGTTRDGDAVVVAAGSWTRSLLAEAGVKLPLQNYRTQLASLAMEGSEGVPILHDLVHRFYARPESDSSFLAGDGTQLTPFEPDAYSESADPEFVASLASRVVARFGRGGEARVRSGWAGLCVATPDRRPLCGPVGLAGLHVLAGDNGFGLMRGLALGERLAEAVAGRVHPETDPRRCGADPPQDFPLREGYGDVA